MLSVGAVAVVVMVVVVMVVMVGPEGCVTHTGLMHHV